jgi:sn-glycerol 3-phosphate transport system substrate-binding protein
MWPRVAAVAGSALSLLVVALPAPQALAAPTTPCHARASNARSITLWHALDGPRAALLQTLATDFEQQSGIEVKLVDTHGGDLLLDDWRHASAKARPTLALAPEDSIQLLADSGTVLPIDDCLERATGPGLLPVVKQTYTTAGRVWALPVAVSTPVLYFNRRAFEAAGLDPDHPPANADELRSASRQIVSARAATYGLAVDTGAEAGGSWFVEQWLSQRDMDSLSPANGHTKSARHVTWSTGPSVSTLRWLSQLVDDKLAVSVGTNPGGSDDLLRLVATTSSAAMALHTSSATGQALDLVSSGAYPTVDLGVAPLPGPGRGGLVGGAGLVMSAHKPASEVAAGWAFAAFLASPAVQARWAAGSGYVPPSSESIALNPLATVWAMRPQMEVAYQQLADLPASSARAGPVAGPLRTIREQLAAATTKTLQGTDPAAALRDAARASNGLLNDYRQAMRRKTTQ